MIKLQKRAARIILDKGIDAPSEEMFKQLSWMEFPERVTFQKAVMMYKIFNNLTPSYLPNYFKLTSEIHQRSLRSTPGRGWGWGGGRSLVRGVPMREQRIVKHTLNSVIDILNLTPLFTVFSLK